MALWSTKAAISLKRIQIEEKLQWGTIELIFALSNGTIRDPLRPPLPQDWGFAPHPKLQSLLSREWVKLRTSNFPRKISVHPNNSPWKILEKRESGRIQGLPKFLGYPYYLRNGKSYRFQIGLVYSEGPSEHKPIKDFGKKGSVGVSRDCPIFLGTPYYLRNR